MIKKNTNLPEKDKELFELYRNREPVIELAWRFGLSKEDVRLKVREAGIRRKSFRRKELDGRKKKSRPLLERDKKMVKLYEEGKTYKELSEEFGISRQRVQQIISREGFNSERRAKRVKKIFASDREKGIKEAIEWFLNKSGYNEKTIERIKSGESFFSCFVPLETYNYASLRVFYYLIVEHIVYVKEKVLELTIGKIKLGHSRFKLDKWTEKRILTSSEEMKKFGKFLNVKKGGNVDE